MSSKGVLAALMAVLGADRQTDSELEVAWRVLPLLGKLGHDYGAELPSPLAPLPTHLKGASRTPSLPRVDERGLRSGRVLRGPGGVRWSQQAELHRDPSGIGSSRNTGWSSGFGRSLNSSRTWLALILEKGYGRLTVQDVLDRADVGPVAVPKRLT